jgi:hypothetical protein
MDQQLVQRTRYLLQARFRRIRNAEAGHFELVCQQVFHWLENHPILGPAIQYLDSIPGEHHKEIERVLKEDGLAGSRYYALIRGKDYRQENEPDFKGYTPKTFEEHASAWLEVKRAAIQKPDLGFYCVLAVYVTQEEYSSFGGPKGQSEALEVIQDTVAHDLCVYLDERLGGINAVNGILRKYKQYAEWFRKSQLRRIAMEYNGKEGERALALHLQQYVFDQGIEFSIEPTSASGEIDLVLRDASGQYILTDAKYVKPGATPSEITRNIAEGFNQVARYCNDYNQPEGFLTIFVNDDVAILIDLEQNSGFRYFKVGSHIIYYIEINIAERPSASKSGKARQISISANELIEHIKDLAD